MKAKPREIFRPMKILRSIRETRRALAAAPRPHVFVPTMGALHRGHLALVKRARAIAGDVGTVIVSIFVNPTQFGPREDFTRYPRPATEDARLCREAGVDFLFMPAIEEMYPPEHSTFVDETQLSLGLCGTSRPGHFRGVCTVVTKLFNIIAPDVAVFGEKDFQQLAVIRRMTRDLDLPVKIIGVPTVRELDGLALSSRNKFLSDEERAQAASLRRGLLAARDAKGKSPRQLAGIARRVIAAEPLARIDYIEALDADSLAPATADTRNLLLACAVFFGKTRLIDNIRIVRDSPRRKS